MFVLRNCPMGHKVINTTMSSPNIFSHDSQICQFCEKGQECNSESCEACSPCQAGYYKAAVSTDPCVACPANTYREETGAVDISNCVSCLAKSSTAGQGGQSSWSSCVCDINYYRIVADSATDACMGCPPGLTCDGSSTVQPVVANSIWLPDGAIFKLQSCPSGYYVFPNSLATLTAASAAQQQCEPCGKGEECTTASCVTCSPCQAGYYKAAVSRIRVWHVPPAPSERRWGQPTSACVRAVSSSRPHHLPQAKAADTRVRAMQSTISSPPTRD